MTGGKHPPRRDFDPDEVTAKVAEKLNDAAAKVSSKLTQKAEKYERLSAKAARHVEMLESASSWLAALDVWTRDAPSARRPRFSRDEIADVAMRIADDEGFDAVSMRRIASELDAGTMTLYHYVRTKDELLSLLVDAIMGELALPPGTAMPDDWREALTVIAHRTRDALLRHPWVIDVTDDPAIGPNSVRHIDQSLAAVRSLPLSFRDKLDVVNAVDEYVFGHCLQRVRNGDSSVPREMVEYVNRLIATGDYPELGRLAEDPGLDEIWRQAEAQDRDEGRFDRNLARLLDGVAAGLPPA